MWLVPRKSFTRATQRRPSQQACPCVPAYIPGEPVCHHSDEVSRRHLVLRKYHLVNKFAFHMLQNYSRQCLLEWLSLGHAFPTVWDSHSSLYTLSTSSHDPPNTTTTKARRRQMRSLWSQKGEPWCFFLPWRGALEALAKHELEESGAERQLIWKVSEKPNCWWQTRPRDSQRGRKTDKGMIMRRWWDFCLNSCQQFLVFQPSIQEILIK